jgi:hypothetical protein
MGFENRNKKISEKALSVLLYFSRWPFLVPALSASPGEKEHEHSVLISGRTSPPLIPFQTRPELLNPVG